MVLFVAGKPFYYVCGIVVLFTCLLPSFLKQDIQAEQEEGLQKLTLAIFVKQKACERPFEMPKDGGIIIEGNDVLNNLT